MEQNKEPHVWKFKVGDLIEDKIDDEHCGVKIVLGIAPYSVYSVLFGTFDAVDQYYLEKWFKVIACIYLQLITNQQELFGF